jgi:threonine dehydratase
MEIIEDVPEVDAVIVPIGGAGLIAGISCAIKTLKPECKVRYCVGREFKKDVLANFLT